MQLTCTNLLAMASMSTSEYTLPLRLDNLTDNQQLLLPASPFPPTTQSSQL
jgi:hypothetical protein